MGCNVSHSTMGAILKLSQKSQILVKDKYEGPTISNFCGVLENNKNEL